MTEKALTLPLSLIQPGGNPRRFFSPAKHDELVASIRMRGLLQPLLVRPAPDRETYLLVAGGRRYRAALEVYGAEGLVETICREMTDQEALEAAIDENDVREDASETEQADAAQRVLAACQDDRAEAARRLGWSIAKLDRRLALAGLSAAVKAALDERRIKVGHAELLAAVPADKQDKALETILSSGIDVAKTRELLQRVTQDLVAATFDKTECAGCGYNSARQRALFETHVDDGHCTNGACFALKVEAHEKARAAAETPVATSGFDALDEGGKPEALAAVVMQGKCRICGCTEDRACEGSCSWANDAQTLCTGCVNKPGVADALPPSTAVTPAKTSTPAAPAKPKVTAEGLRAKLKTSREQAWRSAVAAAIAESADHVRIADFAAQCVTSGLHVSFDQVAALAKDIDVDLRTTWRVDTKFLDQLNKDELKFVAEECGLITFLGARKFSQIFGQTTQSIASSMLNATGFSWAGRIPSCMSLDGEYGSPLTANTLTGEASAAAEPAEPTPETEEA